MKKSFLLFFGLPVFFLLCALGSWQLYRKNEKEFFIDSVKTSLAAEPVKISSLKGLKKYSKIKIEGAFIPDSDLFLYGKAGKDGYYVLSPFKTISGEIILVAAGWVESSFKNEVMTKNFEKTEITGLVAEGEKKPFYAPANDFKRKILITLDIGEISKFFGTNLSPYYLIQIEPKINLPLKPIKYGNLVDKIRNDHKEYAITWFALAAALAFFLIYEYRGRLWPRFREGN